MSSDPWNIGLYGYYDRNLSKPKSAAVLQHLRDNGDTITIIRKDYGGFGAFSTGPHYEVYRLRFDRNMFPGYILEEPIDDEAKHGEFASVEKDGKTLWWFYSNDRLLEQNEHVIRALVTYRDDGYRKGAAPRNILNLQPAEADRRFDTRLMLARLQIGDFERTIFEVQENGQVAYYIGRHE